MVLHLIVYRLFIHHHTHTIVNAPIPAKQNIVIHKCENEREFETVQRACTHINIFIETVLHEHEHTHTQTQWKSVQTECDLRFQ